MQEEADDLLPAEDRARANGWAFVSDLDAFFSRMYAYYYERGFWCILASRVAHLMCALARAGARRCRQAPVAARRAHSPRRRRSVLGFTIVLSTFLLAFMNWTKLLTCHDEDSCLVRMRRLRRQCGG